MKRLYQLDWLRIISAFLILYFHASGYIGLVFKNAYTVAYVGNGAIVMTLFFLLSGFCLYYNYYHTDFCYENITTFYKKRFISIYPAYLIHIFYMFTINGFDFKTILNLLPLHLSVLQLSMYDSIKFGSINGGIWFLSAMTMAYFIFPYIASMVKKMRGGDKDSYVDLFMVKLCHQWFSSIYIFNNNHRPISDRLQNGILQSDT